MNYILSDIKKFLKKLETGQMEIEAGQWELHKDITNLKNAIQELKQLKKDLQMMKQHGLKQTDLIKELQFKLNLLESAYENDQESSTSTEDTCYPDSKTALESVPKIVKKNKKRGLCSGKGITFAENVDKKEKRAVAEKNGRNQCVSRRRSKTPFRDHSILQRYLSDSAKYIDKDKCQKKAPITRKSCSTMSRHWTSDTIEEELRNNYYCKNRGRSNFNQVYQFRKGNSTRHKEEIIPTVPGDITRTVCSKTKSNFTRRGRRHQVRPLYQCSVCRKGFCHKNHLKSHAKTHQRLSKSFRGYRCSYCDKICSSPENLTAHLKRCRIIIKTHPRKKKSRRNLGF